MGKLLGWIWRTVAFYFKLFIFIGVLLLLFVFGVVHALVAGGPIMPDDMWFLFKVVVLLVLPLVAAIATKRWAAFFLGIAASILLALGGFVSLSNYTHAPQFWSAMPYRVENGRLAVPEGKREELLNDCGLISSDRLRGSCELIIRCQEYDSAAYERMGCEELLRKKSSPTLLDMAIQERKDYEEQQRKRGE